MKKLLLTITLLAASALHSAAFAAFSEKLVTKQAELQLVAGGYSEDDKIYLGLDFKLKPGWHIYWRTPGDSGFPPVPNWDGSTNVENTELFWPAPKRLKTEIEDGVYSESYGYENNVLLPIILTAKDPAQTVSVNLTVNYAICADICIPETASLKLEIPQGYHSIQAMELISAGMETLPKENGRFLEIKEARLIKDGEQDFLQVSVTTEAQNLDGAEIFVESGQDFAFYNPQMVTGVTAGQGYFNIPLTYLTDNKSISDRDFNITFTQGENAVEKSISGYEIISSVKTYSFAIILLFGLIGGLILNVMPCVLPVLSIKLLSVIKHSGRNRLQISTSFITTAIGIITSFIALALFIIGLRSAGMNVGWGFHFQEPLFIIALVLVLTFFAANLWGFFEFRLPFNIGGGIYKKSDEHNLLGYFLTGVLATILATPCTAPFLGTAVGFALSRGASDILATFTMMGIGMALPYIIFSMFPELVSRLPKPGAWMVTVKKAMGVLLIIAAIWLIWVLSNQLGHLAAFILLGLSIAKLIKLWASNHIKFLAHKAVKYGIIGLIIVLSFTLPLKVSNNGHKTKSGADIWEPFAREDIPLLVEHGKIIFVDITADWCLTCKVNKVLVLNSSEIINEFKRMDVIAMRADWTSKDSELEAYLMSHNRVGIPFNIVYGPAAPDGIILSELLTKNAVKDAIAKASGVE